MALKKNPWIHLVARSYCETNNPPFFISISISLHHTRFFLYWLFRSLFPSMDRKNISHFPTRSINAYQMSIDRRHWRGLIMSVRDSARHRGRYVPACQRYTCIFAAWSESCFVLCFKFEDVIFFLKRATATANCYVDLQIVEGGLWLRRRRQGTRHEVGHELGKEEIYEFPFCLFLFPQ